MSETSPKANGGALYSKEQKDADQKDVKETFDFLSGDYLLPYAAAIERHSLSLMLADNALRLEAMSLFTERDFYIPAYKHTFKAITALIERGEPVSPITVADVMKAKSFLNDIGGVSGLTNILTEFQFGSKKDLKNFAKKLRQLSTKREVFKKCKEIAVRCFDDSLTSEDILAFADDDLSRIRAGAVIETTLQTYKQVASDTRSELDLWRSGVETSLKTGIPELDSRLWARGLARKELYYFAALSSFGKTALVWQILNYIESIGKRGVFFTLEMSAIKLILRSIQRMSRGLEISPYTILDLKDAKSEKAQQRQEENRKTYERATELLKKIEQWGGLIDQTTRNWKLIKAKIKQAHAEQPLDYIAGDYIQMVENQTRRDRRDLEVKEISNESKELAEILDVPFIWISQLNRGNKMGQRPEFSDLKESSYLEQDADFIGFIYGKAKMKDLTRKLNFYCPKQRNGRAGWEIELDFKTNEQVFLTDGILEIIARESAEDADDFEQKALLGEYARQYEEEREIAEEIEEVEDDEIKF